jgi:transposase
MTTEEKLLEQNSALLKQQAEFVEQIKELNERIAWLSNQLFGRKSEKMVNPNQTSLLDDDGVFTDPEQTGNQSEESQVTTVTSKRKPKRTRKDVIAPDLPVEEEIIERDDLHCTHGHELKAFGVHFVREEVREIPARLYVARIMARTYKCAECEQADGISHIYQAKSPKSLLAHSLVSPSLLAEILLQKYGMGTPLYRQLQQFKRAGVLLTESTVANWVIKASQLVEPLYELIQQHLNSQGFLQGDETPYQVLREPGRSAQAHSYIWVMRTMRGAICPAVLYAYANTRSGGFAQSLYTGFTGVLQCDGYSGYNLLEDSVTRVACWAHVRRYFFLDADKNKGHFKSTKGLDLLNEMFLLERPWQDLSSEARLKKRQEELKPLIDQFWEWCDHENAAPKSRLGSALKYAQKRREALNRVLDYGEVDLSNNASERNMKSYVIGRKNWLFSTSPAGAKANAIWMTMVETAKANGQDPREYLEFLLETISQLPDFPKQEELEACLPWNRKLTKPVSEIA